MSTKTIFAETAATSFVGTDEFEFQLASGGASKKVTGSNIRKQIFAGGTGFTSTDPLTCGVLTGLALVDISGASAGQIKFPATQNASADANTLDDYEEGTWTPTDASGAALSLTSVAGFYEKIGRQVTARCILLYPSTADGSNAKIGGLPFTVANSSAADQGFVTWTDETTLAYIKPTINTTAVSLYNSAGAAITNATMSLNGLFFTAVYHV
jgi:hypothetical protein